MGRRTDGTEALFEEMDGPRLARLGNWLASSLDVSELGTEEVLLLEMVLGRCQDALWRAFPEIFVPLYQRRMALWLSEDEDDDT